ncbi:hypothetical protein M0R45_020674 [Rubus argutus]|uniref:Uncharacterized protein n=1 Tax=Rubus argutus TaxID=59490 RepID=A0AAW1XBD2_RUBAR
MPEKGAMSWPSSSLKSSPLLQWRLGLLTALVLVGMVVIWSMDATTMKNLVEATKSQQGYLTTKFDSRNPVNHTQYELLSDQKSTGVSVIPASLNWVSSKFRA